MSLLYGLSYYCDVLFYFGCMGLLGALWESGASLFLIVLMLFAACSLSHKLRMSAKNGVRYIPMAIALIVLLLARSVPERILLIPPCVYLYLYIRNNLTVADYYYAARKFRFTLLGLLFIMLLTMANQARTWTKGLLWLFLYFALTIFLLRMLRHDDKTINSNKFRLMNALSIGSVCMAGWVFSQPQATAVLKRIGLFLLDHLLAPIASVLLYIIQWTLIGLAMLFERLFGNAVMTMEAMPQLNMNAGMQEVMGLDEQNAVEASPLARAILIGIGIILLSVVVVLLLRFLSRQTARGRSDDVDEVRETIDESETDKGAKWRVRQSATPDSVRAWYQKSLLWMKAHEGHVRGNMNTHQIETENQEAFDDEALHELRALYLPVRYGDKTEVTREELTRMRDAYDRLRRSRR